MNHGSHWHAIFDDDESIIEWIRQLLTNGHLGQLQPADAPGQSRFRYLLGPDQPLAGTGIVRLGEESNEFVCCFPTLLDCAENELETFSTDPVEDEDYGELEGLVTAITHDGTEITFCCPTWLAVRAAMEVGGRYKFGLAALAYTLERAVTEIVLTEGSLFEMEKKRRMDEDPDFDSNTFTSVSVSTSELRMLFKRENGDIEFQSVIEEVTPFCSLGTSGFILLVNLAGGDRDRVAVKLYATAKVLGDYTPTVGDSVMGVAWLQGVPLAPVDAADSWLDSAEAAHGAGDHGVMDMISFCFDNPQLPLAVQAVGGALVGAGWALTAIEQKLFRDWAPAIAARRGDEEFWFFIRTTIPDFCEAMPFGDLPERYAPKAAEEGFRCIWVTVTLTSSGRNYRLLAEGLEELASELRLPIELARPEKFHVINLDQPSDPEPVLDEAHAAAVFADCMRRADLRDLSKILVEDLRYASGELNLEVLGRQQFLSYLGSRLNEWATSGTVLDYKCGAVPLDGIRRACTLVFNHEGKLCGCTVFTGRLGHIESIRNLSADQRSSAQVS